MEDFMNLGKKYLENSKFQKAIKIFLKLANTEMENTGPLFWLSETFIRIGNLKSAEEYIDKALETDNLSFKNQVKKVEIIKLQNGYNSALDYINVLQKNGQANSEAIACLKAEIIAENESVEKAITYLESLKKKDLPEILYRLARFYYEVGDNNNFIDCANQLSDINGTSSKDLHIQALLAWNNGELDRAVDFLVHSIEKDPFIPEKYMHLSQVYADRKEWHAVFETINDGLRIEPENVELWLQKIKFLKINGKLEEAKQNQKAACRIRPNDLRLENLFI
jgi:tetratricopeptide (TPR) repeat protein